MLGFWFGPVIVKNQQVAGTLGWWDPESYDCGSFVECRECRPTIMPHSPPFYRKLQMVHSCIDVSFYQPNVRGFLCNRWWLWLSTTGPMLCVHWYHSQILSSTSMSPRSTMAGSSCSWLGVDIVTATTVSWRTGQKAAEGWVTDVFGQSKSV